MRLSDVLAPLLAVNAGYVAFRHISGRPARGTWLWTCCYWVLVALRWTAAAVGR